MDFNDTLIRRETQEILTRLFASKTDSNLGTPSFSVSRDDEIVISFPKASQHGLAYNLAGMARLLNESLVRHKIVPEELSETDTLRIKAEGTTLLVPLTLTRLIYTDVVANKAGLDNCNTLPTLASALVDPQRSPQQKLVYAQLVEHYAKKVKANPNEVNPIDALSEALTASARRQEDGKLTDEYVGQISAAADTLESILDDARRLYKNLKPGGNADSPLAHNIIGAKLNPLPDLLRHVTELSIPNDPELEKSIKASCCKAMLYAAAVNESWRTDKLKADIAEAITRNEDGYNPYGARLRRVEEAMNGGAAASLGEPGQ